MLQSYIIYGINYLCFVINISDGRCTGAQSTIKQLIMKRFIFILILLTASSAALEAQSRKEMKAAIKAEALGQNVLFQNNHSRGRLIVYEGDTIPFIELGSIYVYSEPLDRAKYARLIYYLKRTYPIAKFARVKLKELEDSLAVIQSKSQRTKYVKQTEEEIKAEYTPILKKMSISQGKVLIKLIDRETGRTSYELVQQLRGKFRAFFWQGIARLFGSNLKEHYDKEGEDKIMERLIVMYEAGLL